MSNDNSFFSNLIIDSENKQKINKCSALLGKRFFYINNYKSFYLQHLKNEYNLIHDFFPNVEIIPESRIKSLTSYNEKVNKILNSDSIKDVYDIFGNRYIVRSVNGCSSEKYIVPILYKLLDFLSYNFESVSVISERTKDYIISPKNSTYQSLHITRVHSLPYGCYNSETQIRSYLMHSNANSGAASHSNLYKQRIPGVTSLPIQLEYHFDKNGYCEFVDEKNLERSFEDFFGIKYDAKSFSSIYEK